MSSFPPTFENTLNILNKRLMKIEDLLQVIAHNTQRGDCIDFHSEPPGMGTNPRVEHGITFTVFDSTGTPLPNTEITAHGSGINGLYAAQQLEIKLSRACEEIEIEFATGNSGTILAVDAVGSAVDKVTFKSMTTPQVVTLVGVGVTSILIPNLASEFTLLKFCCNCGC